MIDMPPPPAYIQLAQAPSPPLRLAPSPAPQAAPAPQTPYQPIGPGLYPPGQPAPVAPAGPAAPAEAQPEQIEVRPLDVGQYLPHTALFATLLITVTPPTGTVAVYTPGFEATPVLFRGPKTSGEIRLNGPTVYIELQDGATGYSVEYLSWREP
jgi:hypothetical protein